MSREQVTKEIYISSTPHETRLAITENDQVMEVHYERENEYTLAGAIYNGKVTRVLPGMQSAFVDIGLERDAFLYVTDFLDEQEDSGDYDRTQLPPAKKPQPPKTEDAEGGITIDAAAEVEGEQSGARRSRRRRRGRGGAEKPPADDNSFVESVEVTVEPAEEISEVVAEEGEPEAGSRREARRDRWRERRNARGRGEETEESVEEPQVATGPAPMFLPGETLRKYNPGAGGAASQKDKKAVSASAKHRPSTEIEVPLTWDGGGVLPGETLSRRKRRGRRGAGAAAEVDAIEQAQTAVETAKFDPPVPDEAAGSVDGPENGSIELHAAEEEENPSTAQHEDVEEFTEESSSPEDEPQEGSAFHRVDPNPPSEFRAWFGRRKDSDKKQDDTPSEDEAEAARHELAHEVAHDLAGRARDVHEVFPLVPDFVEPEEGHEEDGKVHVDLGAGHVEEELIEEDEYEFEALHGDTDDPEFESMTEETLENSGEFGEFYRDSQVSRELADDDDESGQSQESKPQPEGETIVLGDSDALDEDEGEGQERRRRRSGRRGLRGRRETQERGQQGRVPQRRRNAQLSDLPVITELLKPGQEILVQIAKEPIAKKGARITSHIALPGRFLVFMPTVNHIGVSRKIASDEDRQRLKRILLSEKGDAPGGFIVRTAAGSASEQDLRADIRFLINLWTEIKERSEKAKSPALIYHDLNLVERVLRDQVTDKFSAIWVDTEAEYERVVRFLSRFQPALVRHVKLYTKEAPLFEQFGIQDEINKALKSKVWLKSGGSIVINQTEALVAIDINTGKYVGKTARLEDTILKTNLDAIPEIVRQVRLRDLGGIIVIDFIDMDDRRNRKKVMEALEDELKNDRAPSKVLQFNDFGLVAITRKRVKQSLERTLSMPCLTCEGTGMVKNPTTVCNEIYVELRKMHRHLERRDVMLRVNPEVVKQLKSNGSKWLQDMEELAGKTILVKSDPSMAPEAFDIH